MHRHSTIHTHKFEHDSILSCILETRPQNPHSGVGLEGSLNHSTATRLINHTLFGNLHALHWICLLEQRLQLVYLVVHTQQATSVEVHHAAPSPCVWLCLHLLHDTVQGFAGVHRVQNDACKEQGGTLTSRLLYLKAFVMNASFILNLSNKNRWLCVRMHPKSVLKPSTFFLIL